MELLRVSTARDVVEANVESRNYCDPSREAATFRSLRTALLDLRRDGQAMRLDSNISSSLQLIDVKLGELEQHQIRTWEAANRASLDYA